MKITGQTADEMMLKDSNAGTIIIGLLVALVGIVIGFFWQSFGTTAIWVAIGFFVVGSGMVLFTSSITVNINKTTGRIMYGTKRVIGARAATYAVADALRIETRKRWQREGGTGAGKTYVAPRQVLISQSVIIFKDGQELQLDHQNSTAGTAIGIGTGLIMGGSGKEVAIANQIATFLGIPFQEIAPPNESVNINIGGGTGTGIQL